MQAAADNPAPPLLQMVGIDKSFAGVRALQGVDLHLRGGEVLALLGENGAGKSTLIKVLGGAHSPDAGSVLIDGIETRIASPADSQAAGISIIYQEFNLVPHLTVTENIFLGREDAAAGFIRRRAERQRTLKLFERIGLDVDPDARCSELTIAQQQTVEIAKALAVDCRIMLMDEPSAALTDREVRSLFGIIEQLRQAGIGIIYISHRIEEIFEIADRVMVLRDGRRVGTRAVTDIDRNALVEMMVGRTLANEFPKRTHTPGEVRLEISGLTRGRAVRDVSFGVRAGEIVALAGLVGAGRTETARLIFGADRRDAGEIRLDGQPLAITSPADAIAAGICMLTEDRKQQGLTLMHTVSENFALPNLDRLSRWGFVDRRAERDGLAGYVDTLRIRITHPGQRTADLSGGNQQKVVLAKWLANDCDVILFDEPTRGIDVGAKYEIYLLMNRLAAEGKAIIMISSELSEVLGMSDRILVMHAGRIVGEITDVASATQEQVMHLAIG